LAGIAENPATQVSILEKHNKMQEEILNNRKTKLSGKRIAIKGHLVLSTKEIVEKVRKAEEEPASKKTGSKTGSKTGTLPLEDEEESSCDNDRDGSDCIVVGKF
jgi:hypothetical protein